MSDLTLPFETRTILLDDRMRGFPSGHEPLPMTDIGRQGWKPYDGRMSLPLISLDRRAFSENTALMMRYVAGQQIAIAPHAKTPMSTALAASLVEAGAWGTTVADIRQASVMLKAGLKRLLLANEVGGIKAATRLAAVLANHPDSEIHIFVDSSALATALRDAWKANPNLPRLGLLVELGAARAGARTVDAARDILDIILNAETTNFSLSGVAAYEGAAATADAVETAARISGLMDITAEVYQLVRERIGKDRPLIVTAGGSVYFDMVVSALKPVLSGDDKSLLILRSGAIFFHDHGVYERGLASLDDRAGFLIDGAATSAAQGFRPALRLWAEVLSRPEHGLAVCGMGLRDVAMDQGLPRPLALYRDGEHLTSTEHAKVSKLNDQHAFVDIGSADVQIGDVIEFGISHPCTCLDRHALIYGLGDDHLVTGAFPTSFG